MNYLEWNTRFHKGEIAPLYLFYGEEGFLIEESLKKILDKTVPPLYRESNFQSLDSKENNIPGLLQMAKTYPFLAPRRVLVVRNPGELRGDEKALEAYCHDPFLLTTIIFIINQREPQKGKVFFQIIASKGWAVEFPKMRDREVSAWLGKRFEEQRYRITFQARDILLEKVGTNLQNLSQEIEKIILYVGDKNVIGPAEVEAVVGQSRIDNLFSLTDAIGHRKLEKAFQILDRLLAVGETHLAIFGMIQRQFRMIWQMKELTNQGFNNFEIAKKMGQPAWLIQKLMGQSEGFSHRQLNQFFLIFVQADLEFKNSDHSPRHILEFLVFRLCLG